jgi:hypothetical protein
VLVCVVIKGRQVLDEAPAAGLVVVGILVAGGVFGDSTFSPEGVVVQAGVALAFLYAAAVLFLTRRRAEMRPAPRGWQLLLAVWVWLLAVDLAHGAVQGLTATTGRFLSGIVLFTGVYLLRWRGISIRTIAITVIYTFAVASITVIVAINPWRGCDQFKCGALGALLTGPFASENYFGILAAWSCLFGLTLFTGTLRWLTVALGALVLIATGARTSMIALLAAVVMYVAAMRFRDNLMTRKMDQTRLCRPLVLIAIGLTFGVALWLLFTATPETLSNRGNVWVSALAALRGSFTFGLGLDRWEPLTQLGVLPEHFPHNGYLLLLFSGGSIALVLFGVLMTTLLGRHEGARDAVARLAFAELFLLTSITEVVWNPLAVDGFTWIVLALMASSLGGPVLQERSRMHGLLWPEGPYKRTSIKGAGDRRSTPAP